MLRFLIKEMPVEAIECPATEKISDFNVGTFKNEFKGYTPLMLVLASRYSNLAVVKILIEKGANCEVRDANTEDNLLHICAKHCLTDEVFEYILKTLSIDINERNNAGETPLIICKLKKHQYRVELLEKASSDVFEKTMDKLMEEIIADDSRAIRAKQRKK